MRAALSCPGWILSGPVLSESITARRWRWPSESGHSAPGRPRQGGQHRILRPLPRPSGSRLQSRRLLRPQTRARPCGESRHRHSRARYCSSVASSSLCPTVNHRFLATSCCRGRGRRREWVWPRRMEGRRSPPCVGRVNRVHSRWFRRLHSRRGPGRRGLPGRPLERRPPRRAATGDA